MSLPDAEHWAADLSAYLDGELGQADVRRVERLLDRSPQAAALLEELRATSRAIRSLPRAELPAAMRLQIHEASVRRARLNASAAETRIFSLVLRVSGVAAMLAIFSVAGWRWVYPRAEQPATLDRTPAVPNVAVAPSAQVGFDFNATRLESGKSDVKDTPSITALSSPTRPSVEADSQVVHSPAVVFDIVVEPATQVEYDEIAKQLSKVSGWAKLAASLRDAQAPVYQLNRGMAAELSDGVSTGVTRAHKSLAQDDESPREEPTAEVRAEPSVGSSLRAVGYAGATEATVQTFQMSLAPRSVDTLVGALQQRFSTAPNLNNNLRYDADQLRSLRFAVSSVEHETAEGLAAAAQPAMSESLRQDKLEPRPQAGATGELPAPSAAGASAGVTGGDARLDRSNQEANERSEPRQTRGTPAKSPPVQEPGAQAAKPDRAGRGQSALGGGALAPQASRASPRGAPAGADRPSSAGGRHAAEKKKASRDEDSESIAQLDAADSLAPPAPSSVKWMRSTVSRWFQSAAEFAGEVFAPETALEFLGGQAADPPDAAQEPVTVRIQLLPPADSASRTSTAPTSRP